MDFMKRARELFPDTVADRRYMHTHAEAGLELPQTKQFVMDRLKEYGLEPKECGHGVIADIGNGGKVILLKADIDALPMPEKSGLEFACPTGTEAHTCGHDMNAAMLLTAARMLKEAENELKGTVRLMFEPAEEIFKGGKDMIAAGVLENPKVDVALSFHVGPGGPPGGYFYNNQSTFMASCDGFRIRVKGAGSHGAYPHHAKDPINMAVRIYTALQALVAEEADPSENCTLTIGHLEAGTTFNIIPDTAVLEGSIRTMSKETRALLVSRLKEIAKLTAETFHGEAEVEIFTDVPPLICNKDFTSQILKYMEQIPYPNRYSVPGISSSASDDFAEVSDRVPAAYMFLAAGFPGKPGGASHSPEVVFNEDTLPFGACALAHCAVEWLKDNCQ